jgi:transcriptional regulator GlxA family with amidase domain
LSQFHFIRAFKHSVGLSPYQYVLSERISVAKEMLSESDLSIADVALAVGFSGATQLNRKRRTNPAFRISLTRENVCPLTGKLRGTHDERYGAFWS